MTNLMNCLKSPTIITALSGQKGFWLPNLWRGVYVTIYISLNVVRVNMISTPVISCAQRHI